MAERQIRKAVAIVLIVAGAILVLWGLMMWMMPAMMGNMMGGMMGSLRGYMGLYTFSPLLLAAVLIVLAVVLLPRSGARNGEKR